MIRNIKVSFLLGTIFFIFGLVTLPHYGINWDTINHLPRGQAYLHYFLTGKKDYSDLPNFFAFSHWYYQKDSLFIDTNLPKDQVPTRSMYQDEATPFTYYMETDGDGHPPLSDILSAAFNRIFFGKLRLINDIDSYRMYGIFLAASLVGLLYWWVSKLYGRFAGLISALSLSLYPLFWSEAHFNTEKDIPETVYLFFLYFSVWKAITCRNWRWFILSGIFFGLALGTKFNVIFSIFILVPWFLIYLLVNYSPKNNVFKFVKNNLRLIISGLMFPAIGFFIFFATWPYLWQDPITGLYRVLKFYKTIGLTTNTDSRFMGLFGVNTYPIQWIVYTTPIIILVLSVVGIFYALFHLRKEKDKVSLLFLLCLFIPVIRVSWPGATIYGGIRQIMEYIPALAIVAGIGAAGVLQYFKPKLFKIVIGVFLILLFIPVVRKIVEIHPNENVYFNELIGGLSGAKSKNLPSWGNTFGAAYRQGFNYINRTAEKNAHVVFVYELIPNISRILLREDLSLFNSYRSGYLRNGEYAITLTYQGTENRSYYDMYLEKFLVPIYEAKVDDVSIMKVWKNDDAHLKTKITESIVPDVSIEKKEFGLRFNLGTIKKLSRLEIEYSILNCSSLKSGYTQYSKDGVKWVRTPGALPDDWRISSLGEQPKDGKFIEPFVGEKAQFIDIVFTPQNSCINDVKSYKIYAFD